MEQKPYTLGVQPWNVPASLQSHNNWVIWKHWFHPKRHKWVKLPLIARSGKPASSTKHDDWCDFQTAVNACAQWGADGIGYVFNGNGLIGIDYDDKAGTGRYLGPLGLSDEGIKRTAEIAGFWEVSPSGRGLHCITRAEVTQAHKCDAIGIEIYPSERFFCITGVVPPGLDPGAIPEQPQDLGPVLSLFPVKATTSPHKSPTTLDLGTGLILPIEVPAPEAGNTAGFFRSVNDAALQNLGTWVPALLPVAVDAGHGGFRVASYDLGRDLEEDLSISPQGIIDFGVHDMGDAREGKRTPIDLVIEWYFKYIGNGDVLTTPDAVEAAKWLCSKMSVDPANMGWKQRSIGSTEGLPAGVELTCNDDGRFHASKENLHIALCAPEFNGVHIAYDAFKDEIVIRNIGANAWRAFTDADYWNTCRALEKRGFVPVPYEHIRLAVNAVAQERKFDSAIEWLKTLKWDGVERTTTFLPVYFKSDNNEYTRAVSQYLWSALAGRVIWPGCQADMVPVLIGEQGARKTSGVKALSPFKEWFCEVSLVERDDDLSRRLRGRVVGEIGELRGLGTRDLESIKAFITRTHEGWIPKYREFATEFARRLVFVGTTNQNEFLDDETGDRRWLPVIVGLHGSVDVEAINRDCLQLWAEACATLPLTGVCWQTAERLARNVHSKHTVGDPWEEAIKLWLDSPALDVGLSSEYQTLQGARPFSMLDLLKGVMGGDNVGRITRRDETRAAKILRRFGYEKTQIWTGNSTAKRWIKQAKGEGK